jgi:hypothetical protein
MPRDKRNWEESCKAARAGKESRGDIFYLFSSANHDHYFVPKESNYLMHNRKEQKRDVGRFDYD